jgi:hypothetical protein
MNDALPPHPSITTRRSPVIDDDRDHADLQMRPLDAGEIPYIWWAL